jgi:CO dehydrogenase/acetyl-CoA synthase epsilon subunit
MNLLKKLNEQVNAPKYFVINTAGSGDVHDLVEKILKKFDFMGVGTVDDISDLLEADLKDDLPPLENIAIFTAKGVTLEQVKQDVADDLAKDQYLSYGD